MSKNPKGSKTKGAKKSAPKGNAAKDKRGGASKAQSKAPKDTASKGKGSKTKKAPTKKGNSPGKGKKGAGKPAAKGKEDASKKKKKGAGKSVKKGKKDASKPAAKGKEDASKKKKGAGKSVKKGKKDAEQVKSEPPKPVYETTREKIGHKLPWVLGSGFDIPRFRLPDFKNKNLAISTPPRMIALLVTYVFTFWLLMGGIYLWIREQIALGANSAGDAVWLYPSLHDAFIIESIVASAIIFIATGGFYFIYQSTKHAINPSYGRKVLILGLIMMMVGFIAIQRIIDLKVNSQ